jgi:hypothetical protein
MSGLNSKSFADCLHTPFLAESPANQTLALELVQVHEANYSPRLENFSLLFRGPMAPVLPQRIYRLDHNSLGRLEIFLVPLGPDGEGMQYEAVFNRLRSEPK